MAKLKFYLDTRRGVEPFPIMVVITHRNTSAMIQTGLSATPDEWDNGQLIAAKPDARKKALESFRRSIEAQVEALSKVGKLRGMSARDIKDAYKIDVLGEVKVDKGKLFEARYLAFMGMKTKRHTFSIYEQTLKKLRRYCPTLAQLSFEDIDKEWILQFTAWLRKRGYKESSIGIDLRNIRAVFNEAIDDELTTRYPFRKIQIKAARTKDRSMSREELQELFTCPVADWQQEYVDMFKLMFCLRGINMGDLALLPKTIRAGRIEYVRQKTSKLYSIKVEPEAMEIINKYRGSGPYLLSILDRYKDYSDYLHHMNDGLKKVGMKWENGKKYTGEALFPDITTYYARYSWASIAAELDIPKETIAAGLGHSQNDVTAIYIRNDMRKKVDAANRKVLDHVFEQQ